MTSVTSQSLERLAAMRRPPESKPGGSGWTFDRPAMLTANDADLGALGITTGRKKPVRDGAQLWELSRCPYSTDHDDSAFRIQYADGGIHVGCHHARCSGKTMRDIPGSFARTLAVKGTPPPEATLFAGRAVTGQRTEMVSAQPERGVWTETECLFRTPSEISASTEERTEWAACGYLAFGAITDIEGKIKSAGKTTFVSEMCRHILDGTPFLSQPTTQTGIVYLTEQGDSSYRQVLRRAGLLRRDDMYVLSWHRARELSWPGVVDMATRHALANGARVLVADTLGQWSGLSGDSENDAGAAMQAMAPLQVAAARYGLAVLTVRHGRKSGGEVGDSARGSSAFAGAVDIVLSLRRPEGNHARRPNLRQLQSLSRYDETPTDLMIELTGDGYVALGDEPALAMQEARAAITGVTPESEGDALSEAEIVAATGVARATAGRVLKDLVDAGAIQKTGSGKRGNPYRYHTRAAPVPLSVSFLPKPLSLAGKKESTVIAGARLCVECGQPTETPDSLYCAKHGGVSPAESLAATGTNDLEGWIDA